jgi:hypothetical protein
VSLGYHNDIAIIGAVTRDYGGKVYVYYREGNNFIQDPLLLKGYPPSVTPTIASTSSPSPTPTAVTHDFFGWSLDIFDRTIAVGAYQTLGLTTEVQSVGAVYLFYQLSSGWNIESFLRLHSPIEQQQQQQGNGKDNRNVQVEIVPKYDHFGWSLGLFESNLVVGAYGDDDQGTSSGAVYAFERVGGIRYQWTATQKLVPNDGSSYDNFGWSVAISHNTTVIGAYGDRTQNIIASGSVYLYQKFSTSSSLSLWTQIQKLVPYDSNTNGFFGWSVDIWKDLVAVGLKSSSDSTSTSSNVNGVYLYRHEDVQQDDDDDHQDWRFESKLTPPTNRIIPNYGTSVSVSEDTVLVGAYRDLNGASPSSAPSLHVESGQQSGSAFVYTASSQPSPVDKNKPINWNLLKELNSNHSTTERNMKFGSSVKVFGDILLVGAILGDGVAVDTGTVFVFIRSIDISSLGHPLSERTYFTLVLFLPLLFLGTCGVIIFARIFMRPDDHTSGSNTGGGSNHHGNGDDDDESTHSSYSSHQLVVGGRGVDGVKDDEESVHSLSRLVRYKLLRPAQQR